MRKKLLYIISTILIVIILISIYIFKSSNSDNEIKIGAILVLTGQDAKAGQSSRDGIQMAINEINTFGGIDGKKINILIEDDQGDPQKALYAAKKLINIDKVPVIVGPMWSSPLLAVAPIANRNKVVVLSPTASSPNITQAGDYIFRNTYSDLYEGNKTAKYAFEQLNYRKIAIIYINNDFGVGLNNVFSENFEQLGGKIILSDGYDPGSNDFKSQITKLKKLDFDAIYLIGYSEIGQLVKQAHELKLDSKFLSTVMFEISDIVKIAGNASNGVIYAFPSFDPNLGNKKVNDFSINFQKHYNKLPDPEAAFSYDAIYILFKVIVDNGFNSENIKKGLYNLSNFDGVTGKTTFDKNGDVIKPIGFKEVKNGKYVWKTFEYE